MSATAIPHRQGTISYTLILTAFCEACERTIAVRALLDDPHHLTRRQGSALIGVLRGGLRAAQQQLDAVRPALREPEIDDGSATRALAGIGMAVAGVRQIHAHLGYLGARWPLGTADLFVRKLVAEGMPVPVPTLCVTDRLDDETDELGTRVAARLQAIGLAVRPDGAPTPLLAVPAADLLDPLSWPTLLYGLAAALAAAGSRLPREARDYGEEGERARRACEAAVAARLVGEPTFVARAVRALLARLSGLDAGDELPALSRATRPFARPIEPGAGTTLLHYFQDLLALQRRLGGWGRARGPIDEDDGREWPEATALAEALVPAPAAPLDERTLEALYAQLRDGRPINAQPAALSPTFADELAQATDGERFYALLHQANERPCTLATILAAGWRYKLRRTYPLCLELMAGRQPWEAAFGALAAHVLERSSLLQQSIEAAYVQQVFAHWKDR